MKERFECKCDECVSACSYKPGWFLPKEIKRASQFLNLTERQFFNKFLGVDWWVNHPSDIFVLSPAITTMNRAGTEFPSNPKGICVFLNKNMECNIHDVKPFECWKTSCQKPVTRNIHKAVAYAWLPFQKYITKLLGREPRSTLWFSYLS